MGGKEPQKGERDGKGKKMSHEGPSSQSRIMGSQGVFWTLALMI